MKNKFIRRKLLSERKSNQKFIGYARAIDGEIDYLNKQIYSLKNYGCNKIFSEILSINAEKKPQLENALKSLSSEDVFILDKLDRAFQSRSECIQKINKLLKNRIYFKTLSGSSCALENDQFLPSIFSVLSDLDDLEKNILIEKKKELINNKKSNGENIGGRPKISPLKESLVLRLRREGFSYRTIRSQTGVALSTIRRIIIEAEI